MNVAKEQHETDPETRSRRPMRTCVACRKEGSRGELFRLVEGPGGEIALDARARMPGRGAWVHPTPGCIRTAVKRHAIERSLDVSARAIDAETVITHAADALLRKADSLLVVALRKRAVAIGADAVLEALESRRIPLVLLATDAGDIRNAVLGQDASTNGGVAVRTFGTRDELGKKLGRGEVAVAAVTDPPLALELQWTLECLAELEGR